MFTLLFKWSLTYVWALVRGSSWASLRVRVELLSPLLFCWSTQQGLDCSLLHVFIHWEGFLFKNGEIKAIFSTSYKQPHDSISSSVHLTRVAQCNGTLGPHEYLCAFRISRLFLIRTWRSCKSGNYLCLNGENPPALPPLTRCTSRKIWILHLYDICSSFLSLFKARNRCVCILSLTWGDVLLLRQMSP